MPGRPGLDTPRGQQGIGICSCRGCPPCYNALVPSRLLGEALGRIAEVLSRFCTAGARGPILQPVRASTGTDPSVLSILRSSRLFGHLPEEELGAVASRLTETRFAPGQTVLQPGSPSPGLLLVTSGQLRSREAEQYEPGDYLGEATVLGRAEPDVVQAVGEAEALVLEGQDCAELLRQHPDLRRALQLTWNSRRLGRRLAPAWIEPGEVIHMLAHPSRATFLSALSLPLLAGGVSLLGLFVLEAYGWTGYIYALPVLGLLYALPASLWTYWDWANETYAVTNRRVVHAERIPLIYEDRQEAPLRMVLSVEVETSAIRHAVGFGNVVMRTFTRPIIFRGIARPYQVAQVVEELCARDKLRGEQEGREGIERALEERLGTRGPEGAHGGPKGGAQPWASPRGAALSLRYEIGDTIVYRKNYYCLLSDLALPGMLAILGLALGVVALLQLLPLETTVLGLVAIGLFTVGLFWTIYQYVDWANDLYQVTPDQIVALHRKPLGQEDRRSASLENVLSLEYERPGPLARLLNFGTVVATVGNVRFTFDEVHDPVGVQEDIYRRMESHRAQQLETQRRETGEQIAEWLQAYDEVARRRRPGAEKKG
jgi:hypothetical protein